MINIYCDMVSQNKKGEECEDEKSDKRSEKEYGQEEEQECHSC